MATTETKPITSVGTGARRPRANTIPDVPSARSTMDKTQAARDCCSSGSFVTKLYKMVDTEPATIVSWIRGGTAFCIVDPKMMAEHCLPKYFRHRRFSSLIRQLNFYSFYRVQEGQLTIYQHSFFRKGRPDLLVHIKRRGAGKAKDPWFDPLASPPKSSPVSSMPMNSLMVSAPSMDQQMRSMATMADMSAAGSPWMGPQSCYSPMAKPLMGSIDNMSPALKPGMAMLAPPVVDLGASASAMDSDKYMESKRWGGGHLLDLQEQKSAFNSHHAIKSDLAFAEMSNLMLTSVGVMKPMASTTTSTAVSAAMDIDIQDFLTEDCTINAGLPEKSYGEERSAPNGAQLMSSAANAKRAMVARNCLKWDMKTDDHCNYPERDSMSSSHADDDATFEQELLLDLANVEPGAWEVPLSPLNDEEDIMPWLDLCF